MKINLKSLRLKNFKGIKELRLEFGRATNIYGENATGKTTVADAFTWLLFDKDSNDKKDFDIKTLDQNNNVIHGLDHEVEGCLMVNGSFLVLKKTYREKWTKKRGEAERNLTGHTTDYFINDVPVKKSEYTEKVKGLVGEDLFKLITNPKHFNENMNWKDRRNILVQIAGDIDDSEIFATSERLGQLQGLLDGKTIEEFKKMVASQRKKINQQLKMIPARIDEVQQGMPELNIDFEEVEKQIKVLQSDVDKLDSEIMDESKVHESLSKKRIELYQKQSELAKLKSQIEADRLKPSRELRGQLEQVQESREFKFKKLPQLQENAEHIIKTITDLKDENSRLRKEWNEVNSEELTFPDEFTCPTCQQELPEHMKNDSKEKILRDFNARKSASLKQITDQGKRNKDQIDRLSEEGLGDEREIAEINEAIKNLDNQEQEILIQLEDIENLSLEEVLNSSSEYLALKSEIEALEKELIVPIDTKVDDLKQLKIEKATELNRLKAKLATREQHTKAESRIEELMEQEREYAQQIAKLEGQEFACEEFVKAKIDMLERKINDMFKAVSFKLFNLLINGGMEECCETLIKGVPYQSANNAGKINAGMDIINTLTNHYKVSAPIFVDNRESVNNLLESESQIVNLRVSADKKLKVEVVK